MSMQPRDYDHAMTPEQRLEEIAEIFTAGVLRLRAHAALDLGSVDPTAPTRSPGDPCLEVPRPIRPSVHTG
jgi:hypothetical protein